MHRNQMHKMLCRFLDGNSSSECARRDFGGVVIAKLDILVSCISCPGDYFFTWPVNISDFFTCPVVLPGNILTCPVGLQISAWQLIREIPVSSKLLFQIIEFNMNLYQRSINAQPQPRLPFIDIWLCLFCVQSNCIIVLEPYPDWG